MNYICGEQACLDHDGDPDFGLPLQHLNDNAILVESISDLGESVADRGLWQTQVTHELTVEILIKQTTKVN